MSYLDIYDEIKVLDHIPHGLELEKFGSQLQNQLFVQNSGTSRHSKQVTLSKTCHPETVTLSNPWHSKLVTLPNTSHPKVVTQSNTSHSKVVTQILFQIQIKTSME